MEAGEDRPGPFPGPPAALSPARRASSVPWSPHRRGTKPGNGRRRGLGRSFRQEVRAFSQDSAAYRSSAESGGSFFLPPLGRREGSGLGGPAVPRTPRTSAFSSRRKQLSVRIPLSPQTSKWYWDYETQSLKFKSPMPISEIKDKIKRGKSVHFVENDGTTTTERLSEKRFAKKDEKSTKGTDRRSKNDKITLDDAKYVALFLLQDTEMQRIYSFTTFMRNKNLDEFLMALLYYLSHYLQKLSLEKKPKSYMASHIEKKEMELVIEKLQESQKYLAQKYCILVLGLGMPDMHHMACGKEKVSDTQKDWKFFEAFFTFCTYVAWVVFRREYLREIDEEIGRLFRTNMFNSARRRREDEESGEKKRMTFVQFRRMMAKRPAIKTTIHMRSPALSTILPSPKEHAQHLFEKNRNRLGTPLKQSNQKELVSYEAVAMPVVGILGEPRSLFNTTTLLPNEQEQIEQTQEPSKRNISLINENNAKVQQTLELAMKAIGSPGLLIK